MLKLLSLWLAWRAVRLITAIVVIVGTLALLAQAHRGGVRGSNPPLTRLHRAVGPVEQQLERTIERALKE
jgi:hypothetical protein